MAKAHVARALGHMACPRGRSVLFTKTSRIPAEYATGRADGSREARPQRLARSATLSAGDAASRLRRKA